MTKPTAEWTQDEPLLVELSSDLTIHPTLPNHADKAKSVIPPTLQRATRPNIPSIAEPTLARHFGKLARRNHNLHEGAYPLGSCTMKYNPIVDERVASLEGFADLHPYQHAEDAQGTLQLMWELEQFLIELTGMARMSLQPAAGAHGEWAGLRMIQAYHASRGDDGRTSVIVPDSAHGTNPASAALCGLHVITVASNADGTVNVDDLATHLGPNVAAIMMTNPNTLGVFETGIEKIADLAHSAGALLYYDGANLNALVGLTRPGDMGFDVVHLNLHKTFSTPHGGGGPGAGPVGVGERLVPFLPTPTVEKVGDQFTLNHDHAESIGKVRGYYGNVGMLIRAYAYIRAYGREIPFVARDAVLNARYLQSRLRDHYAMAVPTASFHEFVASTKGGPIEGLRALDIAKRLLDYGVYAPTVYFPTTVPEALMIEPTETESKDSLDRLADILCAIVDEAKEDLVAVQGAPYETPVGRVDEVAAARNPVVHW